MVFDQPENGSISYQGSIFVYTPNSDYNGQDTFTYVSDDGDDLSEPALVTLNILPDNDIPILNTIEEISLNEDSNTDIVLSAEDIDGDLLTFSIVNVADEIGATIVCILSISPIPDYNGSGEIIVQVEVMNLRLYSLQLLILFQQMILQ